MILTIDELSGKALDYAYEEARNPDMADIKVENGIMLFYIHDTDAEYGGNGWYFYKSRATPEEALEYLRNKGITMAVVPTDLVSPRYVANKHDGKGFRVFQSDFYK